MRSSTTKCLSILIFAGLTSACSISERAPTDEQQEDLPPWFCELAENETDWQCSRSAAAAKSPAPQRLPRRRAETQPQNQNSAPREQANVSSLAATSDNSTARPDEPPRASATTLPSEDVPLHVALAYRPGEAQRLIDLPGEFWAVQLAAFGSAEQLSEYAARHELRGMSAARIAKNSQLFYVLLLGVYETKENAQRASATVPEALNIDPWIRSLGSLQQAMRAGESLAPAS